MEKDFENYFPHDANASDDIKCQILIEEMGADGYGIYWLLIELLRRQPTYTYPLKLIPIFARKYNTTTAKADVVIRNYGLFVVKEESLFYSESLIRRMAKKDSNKYRNKISGIKGNLIRWGKITKEEADRFSPQEIEDINNNLNNKRIEG